MREILFRGQREDNGEWVEGDLRQDRDLLQTFIDGWDYYISETGLEREPFIYEVIPETVGQYIASDKNGRKVFDGDIMKNSTDQYIVIKWDQRYSAYMTRITFNGVSYDVIANEKAINKAEVIGNIHDDPELLGVGE